MINKIHQTAEEKQASNGEAILSAIQRIPPPDHTTIVRKLDEVKSANLIANKVLKDISDKEVPTSMEVSIKGISVLTLKGDKGDRGLQGLKGLRGEKGDKGEKGIQGIPGKEGKNGKDGKEGVDGKDGLPGTNGVDGLPGLPGKEGENASPDEPDVLVEKINTSKKLIDAHKVKGLRDMIDTVDQIGKNPQGKLENVGGANPLIMLSNGVRVSDFITELNFSTNITPVYDGNGRVTLTASGSGGTTYSETPSGTVNGVNVTFTTTHTITTVLNFAINGMYLHPTADYSTSGTTITFVSAPAADLSGKAFTIVYV